jgi:hypothetical protein
VGVPVTGSAGLGEADGRWEVGLGDTVVSDSDGDGEAVVSDSEGDGEAVVSDSDGVGLASVGLGEALWECQLDLLGYGEWLEPWPVSTGPWAAAGLRPVPRATNTLRTAAAAPVTKAARAATRNRAFMHS